MPKDMQPTGTTPPEEWKSPYEKFRTVGEERREHNKTSTLAGFFWLVTGATIAGAILGAFFFLLAMVNSGRYQPIDPNDRIMTDYDYLVSMFQGSMIAGAGLGLLTGLACCVHWCWMKAKDKKKQRVREKHEQYPS